MLLQVGGCCCKSSFTEMVTSLTVCVCVCGSEQCPAHGMTSSCILLVCILFCSMTKWSVCVDDCFLSLSVRISERLVY